MARSDSNGMTNNAGIAYGELIRRQRKAKKMNQEELGALVKVGKNAVGAWEAGRSRPDVGSVPVICEALDISLEEFFGYPDKSGENIYELNGIKPEERAGLLRKYSSLNQYNRQVILRQMDVLRDMQEDTREPRKIIRLFRNELAASAGPGETLEATRGEEVFLFADSMTEMADEIIRVNGNSMEPTFANGDMVLVKHTGSVREGEIGVFICGDTGYIKEYQKDGLHSHNPEYRTMTFREDQAVRCVGRVIGKLKEEQIPDSETLNRIAEAERAGKEPQ